MGFSRTTKISILLAIDVLFFFVELIAGYAVGSLALVADSFHMLNDVMSLVVALYAIKLTQSSANSATYSYGWHRAEILAALINGVFLLALCFSIFLEAMERFFSVPEVGNPRLVVIVGSLGLASNIVGLFLFHEHGHSHGGHSHSGDSEGPKAIPDAAATPSDVAPLLRSSEPVKPSATPAPATIIGGHRRSESGSRFRPRSDSNGSNFTHPAQVRASLVQVAEELRATSPDIETVPTSPNLKKTRSHSRSGVRLSQSAPAPGEGGTLEEVLRRATGGYVDEEPSYDRAERGEGLGHRNDQHSENDSDDEDAPLNSDVHAGHSHSHHGADGHGHSHSKSGGGHSHSHGNMNMRAVLLHVLGDALGNVGVIATGLIIWLTEWKYKYYCDPMISLIITIIIFSSALPLVKSASFILLQAVPTSVSLEDVRDAILRIPGVISVHELHIWQLSESKIVASVHVLVRKSLAKSPSQINLALNDQSESTSNPHAKSNGKLAVLKNEKGRMNIIREDPESEEFVYMNVAADIRRVLHEFGIHSSTIQPEYCIDGTEDDATSENSVCLLSCSGDLDCDPSSACCPPVAPRPGAA